MRKNIDNSIEQTTAALKNIEKHLANFKRKNPSSLSLQDHEDITTLQKDRDSLLDILAIYKIMDKPPKAQDDIPWGNTNSNTPLAPQVTPITQQPAQPNSRLRTAAQERGNRLGGTLNQSEQIINSAGEFNHHATELANHYRYIDTLWGCCGLWNCITKCVTGSDSEEEAPLLSSRAAR